MQQTNSISDALAEVRASYRLLYNFQKRVLDLVRYISSTYDFDYSIGVPKFSKSSNNNKKGHLTNWAWDWLNMYFYEFRFDNKEIEGHKLHFSIFLLSDNGHFETSKGGFNNRLDTSKFADVRASKSELIFVVGRDMWKPCWGNNSCWSREEFLLGDSSERKSEIGDGIMFYKHYNLELFDTEDNATSIIQGFAKECRNIGIPLSITNKVKK